MNASRFSVTTVISINSIERGVLSLTPHHDVFSQHRSQPPVLFESHPESPVWRTQKCAEDCCFLLVFPWQTCCGKQNGLGGSRRLASVAYTPIPSSVPSFCSSPTGSRFFSPSSWEQLLGTEVPMGRNSWICCWSNHGSHRVCRSNVLSESQFSCPALWFGTRGQELG